MPFPQPNNMPFLVLGQKCFWETAKTQKGLKSLPGAAAWDRGGFQQGIKYFFRGILVR